MSAGAPLDQLARTAHPRLALLVVVGGGLALVGGALALSASTLGRGLGTVGLRVAIVGFFAFALGASGYLAFAVFERGFE